MLVSEWGLRQPVNQIYPSFALGYRFEYTDYPMTVRHCYPRRSYES